MNSIFPYIFKSNLIIKNVSSKYRFSTSVINRNKVTETYQRPTYQPVADYYAGKSVFVTGGTGFVGRLLVERLLYTCNDIEKVYVLIRAKENATVQQRLQELLRNPIFTKLKRTKPQSLNKIVPIGGDVSDVGLGVTLEDEQTLIEKVSVIFHSAANVKFRAPLSEHMSVNYEGTKQTLELGQKIKNLDVFVHVSTVFHNSKWPVRDEIVYPSPRHIDDTMEIITITHKGMAESYVAKNHGKIRTIIVRPSMVTSVYKEPLKSYTDSWVVGTVLAADTASGLVRIVHGKKDAAVELIPADYVCNFLIIAAAKCSKNEMINVYNISSGHSNPIEWEKFIDIYNKEGKKHGYTILPYPKVYFTRSTFAIPALRFVTEVLPAFAADLWLRLLGEKPRYLKLQRSAAMRTVLSVPVTFSSWDVKTTKARELMFTLDSKDRHTFPCDPVTIDWNRYIPMYCKGVKEYMLGSSNNKNI